MTNDIQQASSLISNLQKQEAIMKECTEQFESVDMSQTTLINQLKEALSEQETKSELLRNQLKIARVEAEHASQLRQRLGATQISYGPGSNSTTPMTTLPSEQTVMMQNAAIRPISPQFQPLPATSLGIASAAGDEPKKTAAAMADKLASLSSPEQVLSSILASLAAEEAASMNGGSPSGEHSAGPPGFQTQKRPRLENPMQAGDMALHLRNYHRCNNRLEQHLLLLVAHKHRHRQTKHQAHFHHLFLHCHLGCHNFCSNSIKVLEECSE